MNPQLPPHAATTRRAFRYLDRLLETVALQPPLSLVHFRELNSWINRFQG